MISKEPKEYVRSLLIFEIVVTFIFSNCQITLQIGKLPAFIIIEKYHVDLDVNPSYPGGCRAKRRTNQGSKRLERVQINAVQMGDSGTYESIFATIRNCK